MSDSHYKPCDDKDVTHDGFRASKHPRWGQAAYDRALALDPTLAKTCNFEGLAFCTNHDYEQAVIAFDRALVLDPICVEGWINKGNALY
jgi:lipoprotein NlpI